MLTRLRLQDFKSFADQEIVLSPMTVLVGANASGKSNLLDAIRFLQGLDRYGVVGGLNGEMANGRQTWPGIRGGTVEAARGRRDRFTITVDWDDDRGAWGQRVLVNLQHSSAFSSYRPRTASGSAEWWRL